MASSDPDADATSHQYDTHMETGKGNAIGQNARVTNYHYGLPQPQGSLEAYFDKMDNMKASLLKKNLLGRRNETVVNTARVLTLRVLPSLDKAQKRQILLYLHASELIKKDQLIISLASADLSGADLSHADLRGANLSGTNLSMADLSMAKLSGADLSMATKLIEANLSGTDLSGANLSYANLRGADLSMADLSHANLRGALLSGATVVRQAQLKETWSLQGTIMPDGSTHP